MITGAMLASESDNPAGLGGETVDPLEPVEAREILAGQFGGHTGPHFSYVAEPYVTAAGPSG